MRGGLGKPEDLGLPLLLKVSDLNSFSPVMTGELYNSASDSELLLRSGSNGSCIPQPLTPLSLYRATSSCLCQNESITSVVAWRSWRCLCRSLLGGLGGGSGLVDSGHDNELWGVYIYMSVFLFPVVEHRLISN